VVEVATCSGTLPDGESPGLTPEAGTCFVIHAPQGRRTESSRSHQMMNTARVGCSSGENVWCATGKINWSRLKTRKARALVVTPRPSSSRWRRSLEVGSLSNLG
jgi:hypothetical protein